jgi:hypothetical protein
MCPLTKDLSVFSYATISRLSYDTKEMCDNVVNYVTKNRQSVQGC